MPSRVTPLGPERYLLEAWPDGELDASSHRPRWTLPNGSTLLEGNESGDQRLVFATKSLDGSASLCSVASEKLQSSSPP